MYACTAYWHSKGGTQNNKPGNERKGNDVLVAAVESTDTEDEKEGRTWEGERKNYLDVSEDIAVANGSS
jgi:RecA-family ATPase